MTQITAADTLRSFAVQDPGGEDRRDDMLGLMHFVESDAQRAQLTRTFGDLTPKDRDRLVADLNDPGRCTDPFTTDSQRSQNDPTCNTRGLFLGEREELYAYLSHHLSGKQLGLLAKANEGQNAEEIAAAVIGAHDSGGELAFIRAVATTTPGKPMSRAETRAIVAVLNDIGERRPDLLDQAARQLPDDARVAVLKEQATSRYGYTPLGDWTGDCDGSAPEPAQPHEPAKPSAWDDSDPSGCAF